MILIYCFLGEEGKRKNRRRINFSYQLAISISHWWLRFFYLFFFYWPHWFSCSCMEPTTDFYTISVWIWCQDPPLSVFSKEMSPKLEKVYILVKNRTKLENLLFWKRFVSGLFSMGPFIECGPFIKLSSFSTELPLSKKSWRRTYRKEIFIRFFIRGLELVYLQAMDVFGNVKENYWAQLFIFLYYNIMLTSSTIVLL